LETTLHKQLLREVVENALIFYMEEHKEARTIWEAFRAGQDAAFARLFHLYGDTLFHFGYSITTDRALIKDSIQELLCSLWERKTTLPEVTNVKYFLISALRRILLRKIEQQKRFTLTSFSEEQPITTDFSIQITSREEDLIQQEIKEQTQLQLRKVIQSLPPRQREAIHLRYYQGLSYAEMAEVMAVQKSSIGHFIAQAIKALRKSMNRTMILLSLLFFNLLHFLLF